MTRRTLGLLLLAALPARPALGDGGVVRLSEVVGPLRVTVFTSPAPLRAGPADVSFLIQDAATNEVVRDAAIEVSAACGHHAVAGRASHEAATNRMLQTVILSLHGPGRWEFTARITAAGRSETISFGADVAGALPPWRSYWPWFALPAVAIALFAGHQALARRQA